MVQVAKNNLRVSDTDIFEPRDAPEQDKLVLQRSVMPHCG